VTTRPHFTFDGLVVANWGEAVFRALRQGHVSGINATCAVWENARDTFSNIGRWLRWFEEFPDLICPVMTVDDLDQAAASNRTGVILGFQNLSPIEDQLDYLWIYRRLGVGVMQLTYNTANLVGSGCYESDDTGLTDYGREVIGEMNRARIIIDLSHVGEKTSIDAIALSRTPVVMSHVLPRALKEHPRNKSWELMKQVVDGGGLVGVTMFPAFLPKGSDSTVDDYAEAIELVADHLGRDQVAFGTDFSDGHDAEFFRWITHDKGYARQLTAFQSVENPSGIRTIEETPNLAAALARRGWPENDVAKLMGGNWRSYLERVWGS
jgi:membrane dipeptidase